MTLALLMFAGGALLTLLTTPLVIRLACRCGAMDMPGERKLHDHPVPRLGGVALFGSFAAASILALLLSPAIRASFMGSRDFWLSLAAGGTVVFLLGLYDDLRSASVWTKFVVQAGAAAIIMGPGGVRITAFANPFDGSVQLGWLWIPLTGLWIVGVTNALNLIDGLDGLAGGVAFISVATLFAIAFIHGQRLQVVLVTAVLAGALLGFLKYNFHPARIFMGDCGSMFLGYVLAVLSVVGSSKRATALALLIPILILGIPVFDTLYSMGRRVGKKLVVDREWQISSLWAMFRADKAHIHHTLMAMGYTHRRSVLILYGLSALFGLMALAAVVLQNDRISFALMLAGLVGFVVVKQFGRYIPLHVNAAHAAGGTEEGPKEPMEISKEERGFHESK